MAPSLRDRLQAETREAHARLDDLPVARALSDGTLPLDALLSYLRSMRTIWESFEELLGAATDPRIEPFRRDALVRADLAARDIDALPPGEPRSNSLAEVRAQLLAHHIRLLDRGGVGALLGCLYTFEGSLLGGRVLGRGMLRGLGALGEGSLSFLLETPDPGDGGWNRFVERLDSTPFSAEEHAAAASAASMIFERIAEVMEALHPVPDRTSWFPARELNPEAGAHRVTVEPDELEAALRAGERSWNAQPYYAARYGDRGRAFTRSDSAWLVTLSRIPESRATEHVLWLGHVLAARGMPLLLLERHLRVLHDALVARVSNPGDRYGVLEAAASTLGGLRRRYMSDGILEEAERRFTGGLPTDEKERLPGAGTILAAAVADDRAGVVRALESVEAWFTDRDRFSAAWVDEVNEVLAWAAEQVGGHVPG